MDRIKVAIGLLPLLRDRLNLHTELISTFKMTIHIVAVSGIGTSRQLLQRDIMAAIVGLADVTINGQKRH